MRQIVLDTETTGLETAQGHRIIEIGALELDGRRKTGRTYHIYLNPEREVDAGAVEIHGITNEFLADKPCFADIADEFFEFINGADLVIHNAPFDVGFMDHEFALLERGLPKVRECCSITDTLVMARQMHPGQRNTLDALCKRYEVDNSQRDLHGALLDAEILADLYLTMTGGQVTLLLDSDEEESGSTGGRYAPRPVSADRPALRVVRASEQEAEAHEAWLDRLDKAAGGQCVWRRAEDTGA
ncbi:DNA polymerase III subunit epsilon [Aquisalimonas sp. 2447]|uniref:DNA polymerase III subunit epsilon n=1 Tax=Aquisalimonas sp. 2447 TaxID=2740807 RepID=UPI0014327BCF|nr:DNA polymerase III subunit epsilon [Aquisalimonas sp. 2447]QIT54406.1 DNA polymerase III subunit epsilon [Aquisalimonas sp. 2447]